MTDKKKTIRAILYAAVFAVLAVSCQKEINGVEPVANTKETIEISINGLMGEYTQVDATKASLVNNVRVSWEGGETVYVFDGTECIGSLVASLDGTEDRYALLSTDTDHTVKTPATGTEKLTLVYSPLLTEAPAVSEGAISISLANQSSTKAPFVAYATLDYNNEETINNAIVPFKFATSVIKVNCTGLYANTAIDNATLSNVNTACKLTLSGTSAPTVAGDANGTITRTGDEYFAASKVNAEGEAVFQIAVPVLQGASEARILTVAQGQDSFEDKNFTTKSLSAATSVNTVCQLVHALPDGALPGEFTVDSSGKKVYFSKGNLQATYDGINGIYSWAFADHQYDYVGSVAGNTTIDIPQEAPRQTDGAKVDLFGWSPNALHVKGTAEYYGINVSISDSDYMVSGDSVVDWGSAIDDSGTWRVLSKEEWWYLFKVRTVNGGRGEDKTYSFNITYCGKMGLVIYPDDYIGDPISGTVTELPDGVVFLPAAGRRYGSSEVAGCDRAGNYWSSSPHLGNSAYRVYFSDIVLILDESADRFYGYSVRLVTDVKE